MSKANISFNKEMHFEYGDVQQITGLVRRLVAKNPSGFTFYGTNTYIIGHDRVVVIDPGPALNGHIKALENSLLGETVEQILVTHTHQDHSPGAALLKNLVGGEIWGAPLKAMPAGDPTTESIDYSFSPDHELKNGDFIKGDGWSLEAVFTPGHMSNHMCFALDEEKILFTGDHIMGWNTTIVSPPDGNMGNYMESLEVCLARKETTYWPAHGPAIIHPKPFTQAYRKHRLMREKEILHCIEKGLQTIANIVPVLYKHLPEKMYNAAGRSVLAHLQNLVESGKIKCDGIANEHATYKVV